MSKQQKMGRKAKRKTVFYWVMLVLILLVLVFLAFSALMMVQNAREENGGESGVVGSQPAESQQENEPPVLPQVGGNTTSSEAISQLESEVSSEETSSEESASTESTEQVPFEGNPIDQELERLMDQANTTADAVNVYNRLIESWKEEIQREVTVLSKHESGIQKEQAAWEKDAAEKIAAKEEEYKVMGGSLAQLELAGYLYELYRSRAEVLYEKIGAYDASYTVAA